MQYIFSSAIVAVLALATDASPLLYKRAGVGSAVSNARMTFYGADYGKLLQ